MTANAYTNPWPDEKVEMLKRLVAEGMSYSAIGRAIGVSRNAAIGKAHRIGIRTVEASAPGRKAAKPAPARRLSRKEAAEVRGMEARIASKTEARPPKEPPPAPDQIAANPIPWTQRKVGFCAAPVGGEGADTLYCGNKCEPDKTYCPGHSARFFVASTYSGNDLARSLRRFA